MGQIAKGVQTAGRRMTAFGIISIVVGIASIAAPLVTGVSIVVTTDPYDRLPFFYSDLFDLGYEAVGELDPRLDTLADRGELGVGKNIYYYRDSDRRPRGVLLWNVFGQVDAARELIRAGEPVEPGALAAQVA